jgi:hypothetical protein
VAMNRADVNGHAVDFAASAALNPALFGASSGLRVQTRTVPSDFTVVDFDRALFEVTGELTFAIAGFVYLSGEFAISQAGPLDVILSDGSAKNALNLLRIGASNVDAFVGVGAQIDASGELDLDDAIGVALTDLEVALALFKPAAPTDNSSYYALSAAGGVELVGIDVLTLRADLLTVSVNGASAGPAIDLAASFPADSGLRVATGPDAGDYRILDFRQATLQAAGDVTLIIDGFVWVTGEFAFTQGPVNAGSIVLSDTNPLAGAVNVLTIGGNNIDIFVGMGNADANDDGELDSVAQLEASGAIGLVASDIEVALALIKPVLTPEVSYYALSASGTVALVGVPGVRIEATVDIRVNQASSGAASPTAPPAINFAASFPADGGLKVLTGPDPAGPTPAPFKIISFTQPVLAVAGNVAIELDFNDDGTPEISLATFISFEQTVRPNGTQAIKLALTNTHLVLGDPATPIFDLTIPQGLIFITNEGMAASFTMPALDLDVGPLNIAGALEFQINTTTVAVNETFVVDRDRVDNDRDGLIDETNESVSLVLPAGPFLRLAGSIDLSVTIGDGSTPAFTLSGDFAFEQVTLVGGVKAIRVGAANVAATIQDPDSGNGVSFSDGAGGFVILPTGIAGVMSLTTDIDLGFASAGGTVVLEINNTGGAVNQTISVGGRNIAINFTAAEGNVLRFAVLGATIEFPPFFSLSGDFTVQSVGDETLYGARNVEIFLGYVPDGGSLRDAQGNIKPGAVGLLVTNAVLGMIEKPGPNNTKLRAVYAFGHASLIGLDGLTVQGTITVRINNLGQAVDRLIELPDDPAATTPVGTDGTDNNGNGLIDEAGETAAIRVRITQGRIEQFAIGLDESGNPEGSSQLLISAAGIFEIRGAVQFTRSPSGRVDVDIPDASVNIRIPDGSGGLQDVFGIRGAAKFFFGGVEGFQLQSLQVRGYSLFGANATLPPALSSLVAPTADLASPFQNQIVDVADLIDIGGVKYLAVTFNDVNRVGLNNGTITDPGAEFLITATSAAGTPLTISVNDGGVIQHTGVNNNRTFLYPLTVDAATLTSARVQVTFLANSWSDAAGKSNAAEIETFTLFKDTQPAADAPHAVLANPFNGQSINKQALSAKRYIDVTFVTPAGTLVDPATLDGNELKLLGPGAANIDKNAAGFVIGSIQRISASTYRFFLQPKAGVTVENTFVDGEITVQFAAGSWTAGTGAAAIASAASSGTFTVAGAAAAAATNPEPIDLGPLDLFGPSVELVKTGFKDGQLVLTVAIGVNRATLSFGSLTAEFTGLLGTFDVQIDVLKAVQWVTGSGSLSGVFSVPGKFRIDIAALNIEVPNAFRVGGTGIAITYDPGYDPAANAGAPQQLVVVQSALITFPSLGVTGAILPNGNQPGLIVYDNGFAIGEAMLIYDPDGGAVPAGSSTLTPSGGSGQKIAFGDILEFDDLRIGVTNFRVSFDSGVTAFNGTVFIASGGAKFLPGRPVSATLSDRLSAEPDIAPGFPDTEAVRAALEFENGQVKGFIFKVDTLRITLGSFLTLTATDLFIDTGAAATEELVSFTSVGAEVTIGSLKLGGQARNFAFLGNGTFVPKAGFGVFLEIGSADGSSFMWPDWMPVRITQIGIVWPGDTLQTDPSSFQLILSATVTSLKGMDNLQFSGTVEGIVIDIGLLKQGKFPVLDIASIGVRVEGDLFGGQLKAALIGGIIKLDANAQVIDALDTTSAVADRVFFIGVEGGFTFSGMGGFSIRFAVSELGPLGVFLSASLPTGIIIYPPFGLTINDFSAGVEFFKSLPSIEEPEQLRGPEFALPTALSPDQWLAGVKQQVVAQYRAIKANPGMNGFTAAFTAPMLITGGAKIYTQYTSKEVFNGEIIIRFSTDGKFLIIGKLNFASDNLSITGKLYADLSKIARGEATILFLADIPDQVQLLTIDGKFKMGFRNPDGEEAFFTVVDPRTGKPYAKLAGPADAGVVGRGSINGRGYIDISFPATAGG